MSELRRYRCDVCGYVHEGPEPPETCPVCGVGREMFSLVEEPPPAQATTTLEAISTRAWRCTVCGYVHEGSEPPRVCPVCSVGPELFVPEEESAESPSVDTSSEHIVIVGAGGAGLTAAEHVRKHGARIPNA